MAYEADKQLAAQALQGDVEAKTQIVTQHQSLVYSLALKLLNDTSDAENVLQDTFLKVFEKLDSYAGKSALQTWIYRIAMNEALMTIRKRRGGMVPIIEDPDEPQKAKYESMLRSLDRDPLETLLDTEFKSALQVAMTELPDSWRIPFILKDIEGLSLKEIAAKLDTTVSAVKSSLHRGRSVLRDKLADFIDKQDQEGL
ncbi:sigma-70 family RNA polymerase sigma factor [bacterium]|nr:sigma-70 family RNA polymerase sigma factor [bacterium]